MRPDAQREGRARIGGPGLCVSNAVERLATAAQQAQARQGQQRQGHRLGNGSIRVEDRNAVIVDRGAGSDGEALDERHRTDSVGTSGIDGSNGGVVSALFAVRVAVRACPTSRELARRRGHRQRSLSRVRARSRASRPCRRKPLGLADGRDAEQTRRLLLSAIEASTSDEAESGSREGRLPAGRTHAKAWQRAPNVRTAETWGGQGIPFPYLTHSTPAWGGKAPGAPVRSWGDTPAHFDPCLRPGAARPPLTGGCWSARCRCRALARRIAAPALGPSLFLERMTRDSAQCPRARSQRGGRPRSSCVGPCGENRQSWPFCGLPAGHSPFRLRRSLADEQPRDCCPLTRGQSGDYFGTLLCRQVRQKLGDHRQPIGPTCPVFSFTGARIGASAVSGRRKPFACGVFRVAHRRLGVKRSWVQIPPPRVKEPVMPALSLEG